MDPPCKPATELERSASVLARQLAMAKLTGQPPPAAPTGLLEPLPTLEQLQQRAASTTRPRLARNNTVTSAGGPGQSEPLRPRFWRSNTVSEGKKDPTTTPPAPADRQAIGANLIRKLSARRGPTPTPTPTTTTTIAAAQAAGDRDGGGGDAASFQPLAPPLPLPSLPFSQPPPLTPSQAMEEEEDREDPATAAAAGVPSFSLRSGSVTSAATTTTTTTSSSSSSSYTFPPSSNYRDPAAPPPRIDPRLVRPLATFGIRAVEEVQSVPPSRRGPVNSAGGGGGISEEDPTGGGYRCRERGSSASSSVLRQPQQQGGQGPPRSGSISVSSMLSSPGGTDEEEPDKAEEEEEEEEGGGDGFPSSGSLPQDPATSSSRMRTDRLGSIGLGLGGGGATGGSGPGFFDQHHHHQFSLSSGAEALRDAASFTPEEGTTPTLAQTSRLEGGGGGGAAEGAESTPRLPPPVVGSEDPVSRGGVVGGGVETTPRLGHPDQGEGSSSRSRTPTRTPAEAETSVLPTATATETARFSPSAAVTTTTTTTTTTGRATPPPPPSELMHSHHIAAPAPASSMSTSPTAAATDRHPSPLPPPPTKPPRSLALTLSDYHPFGDPPHPAAAAAAGAFFNSNTSGRYSDVTGARGASQTPLVPDPISPTSVIPNPMEAIEFPPSSTATPESRRNSPSNDTLLRREQKPTTTTTTTTGTSTISNKLRVPTPAAASHHETRSPSPASGSVRSFRSGIATATVTEEEQEGDEANARDLAAATSSDSPNLTSRSAGEDVRPELVHTSSTDSTWSAEGGGGGGTVPVANLPPFEPRVTRLPAAELPANRILAKLDSILGPEPPQQSSPSMGLLDPPPRKLLLSSPVLQVVNANTVKDRYLLLFTDMLVIAKPLIEDHALTGEPILPDLDGHFLVKSVVECKHLKLSADEDPVEESSSSSSATAGGGHKKKHPLLVAFVNRFANDPARAIASLISKGGLANDGPTIANLLYRNTDLNRNQLGAYLSDRRHRHVLRAYIDRFRFAGVRIDDALRLFLMSVRLPFDGGAAADYVIGVLANMWAEANTATGIDGAVAHGLMTAIMRLSDALHGGDEAGERFFRGSKPPVPPTVDDFIASFRDVDTRSVVPEDLLARIYTAVRRERVENASDNSIFSMTPDIEATIEPAKLPTQLTYRTPSARFTITIPEPDPKFTIKLQGADLQFDPPVLAFARNATQSFRVTGTALGVRTMVLIKRGANAPRYQGLPLNKAFSIERGFMQHTFQLSFTNHLDLKRKYMFSCRDVETRSQWLRLLRERIAVSAGTPVPATPANAAANAVAVQVLRDALLDPEEPGVLSAGTPSPRPNVVAPRFGRPVTPSTPRGRLGTPTRPATAVRSNSISRLYPVLYRQEAETGEKRTAATSTAPSGMLTPAASGGGKASTANSSPNPATSELSAARLLHGDFVKSGHELVVTTEQNSLLPLVLTFLNAGLEAAPHPLSLRGSAFQLPPLDGTPAPLPSFVSQP